MRGDNYAEIITDLIGVKLIINYRGKWPDIHREIIKRYFFTNAVDRLKKVQEELEAFTGQLTDDDETAK